MGFYPCSDPADPADPADPGTLLIAVSPQPSKILWQKASKSPALPAGR